MFQDACPVGGPFMFLRTHMHTHCWMIVAICIPNYLQMCSEWSDLSVSSKSSVGCFYTCTGNCPHEIRPPRTQCEQQRMDLVTVLKEATVLRSHLCYSKTTALGKCGAKETFDDVVEMTCSLYSMWSVYQVTGGVNPTLRTSSSVELQSV